jgi:hypothetical protein
VITDPRIVLKAMNDDLHDYPVESDADHEYVRHMLLVRAVVLVACELRGLRDTINWWAGYTPRERASSPSIERSPTPAPSQPEKT